MSREQPFNADGLSNVFMTFVLGTFSQCVTLDVFPCVNLDRWVGVCVGVGVGVGVCVGVCVCVCV